MRTLRRIRSKKLYTKKVYSKKDYSSNDGMLVSVWGPSMWHYLHTMSFNYPMKPNCNEKKHYRDFVLNLKNVLPCGKCRMNLRKNFKKLPLRMKDMESRNTFSRYLYKLHEIVNKMLNKKSGLSYEDVRERYEHFRARCSVPSAKIENEIKDWDKKNEYDERNNKHDEKGCVNPLYGEKSKCILKIVPQNKKCDSLQIDNKCIKHRLVVLDKNPK
jgi:Erv1 / Alr family